MSRTEKKLKLSDEKFKRRIGTTKPVFLTMLDILETAHVQLHRAGGKPNRLAMNVMEHPIERPKKSRKTGIPARRSVIRSNHRSLRTAVIKGLRRIMNGV